MNLESNVGSALSKVEPLAMPAAVLYELFKQYKGLESSMQNLLNGQIHMTELRNLLNDVSNTPRYRADLMALIATWLLNGVSGHPAISKVLDIVQQFTMYDLAVGIGIDALYFSTHSPSPTDFSSSGSLGWR